MFIKCLQTLCVLYKPKKLTSTQTIHRIFPLSHLLLLTVNRLLTESKQNRHGCHLAVKLQTSLENSGLMWHVHLHLALSDVSHLGRNQKKKRKKNAGRRTQRYEARKKHTSVYIHPPIDLQRFSIRSNKKMTSCTWPEKPI